MHVALSARLSVFLPLVCTLCGGTWLERLLTVDDVCRGSFCVPSAPVIELPGMLLLQQHKRVTPTFQQ